MTVSQELREWAMYDRHADVNKLSYSAWKEMCDARYGVWYSWFEDHLHVRAFALLVACALEDE
jgi:hypothetical protein